MTPLSLVLFIMVMEALSSMIINAENGHLEGFEVGNGSLKISHLEFADYMIFFL